MRLIDGHTLAEVIADLRGEAEKPHRGDAENAEQTQDYSPSPCPPRLCGDSSAPSTAVALTTDHSTTSKEFFRKVAEPGQHVAEALDHANEQGIIHRDIKPSNLMQSEKSLTMTGDLVGTLRT